MDCITKNSVEDIPETYNESASSKPKLNPSRQTYRHDCIQCGVLDPMWFQRPLFPVQHGYILRQRFSIYSVSQIAQRPPFSRNCVLGHQPEKINILSGIHVPRKRLHTAGQKKRRGMVLGWSSLGKQLRTTQEIM